MQADIAVCVCRVIKDPTADAYHVCASHRGPMLVRKYSNAQLRAGEPGIYVRYMGGKTAIEVVEPLIHRERMLLSLIMRMVWNK